MQRTLKRLLLTLLTCFLCLPVWAADNDALAGNVSASNNASLTTATIKADGDAALSPALLGLLVMKGVLTSAEANTLRAVPAATGMSQLLNILKDKGVVTDADLVQLSSAATSSSAQPMLATATVSHSGGTVPPGPESAPAPAVIPAVAPLRVLPIDIPKQGGLVPDLKLGSGANFKLYGFYKASAVSDTASSGGPTFGSQDWPLPLLIGGDTGPTSDPQFHIKARAFRIGGQTEWVPKGSDFTITGRVEADFEGDYTDVNNRNISSVRSNQLSLRLAWVRLDHKLGNLPWYAEFGQDWSLMGSSTLPNLFETTGLGVGMGSLYERMPQFKTGVQFHSGDLKIEPDFAIVLPVSSDATLTADQHLRFGDRAGAESNEPGVEARVVFQFPLSHSWKGVAPAQIIFSGHHATMNEIIPHVAQASPFYNPAVPNVGFSTATSIVGASNCPQASGTCNLAQIFTRGAQVDSPQDIWTTEVQLPTPWVTLVGKYYHGGDMRFFFAGQLNTVWANTYGRTNVGTGISESGVSIPFGCSGGVTVGTTVTCPGTPVESAILKPVAGSGGFAELSFPLSRIFHANPEGLNSGWVLHVQYGTDRAKYSDAQHANFLGRTDLDTASLTYRLNKWVTFAHEVSYIVTHTANAQTASGFEIHTLPFEGLQTRQAHNWRNEFGPIFTF